MKGTYLIRISTLIIKDKEAFLSVCENIKIRAAFEFRFAKPLNESIKIISTNSESISTLMYTADFYRTPRILRKPTRFRRLSRKH